MNGHRHHLGGNLNLVGEPGGLTISCDDCAMHASSACTDCVVTFVLRSFGPAMARSPDAAPDTAPDAAPDTAPDTAPDAVRDLELDPDQATVLQLFSRAGMVPLLKFQATG